MFRTKPFDTYSIHIGTYSRPELMYDEFKKTGERKFRKVNPHSVGVAVYRNGTLVGTHSKLIGRYDSLMSGLIGLLIGCNLAHREKAQRVIFYTSSKALIDTIRHGPSIRLKFHIGTTEVVKQSLSQFGDFSLNLISEKDNRLAHKIASMVFKTAKGKKVV